MFDLDQFIADCRVAISENSAPKAVREVLSRAIADPQGVLGHFAPLKPGVHSLYRSSDLTILTSCGRPS